MKKELNFLELRFLVDELSSLVGARVDKVYEPDGLLFVLHKSGSGKLFLRVLPNVMYFAREKPEAPDSFSGLCAVLRRYVEGKKLTSLEQVGSERIVRFVFETQKEKFFLYVELFQQGNVILTDSSNKILGAREERAWKDRAIRRGLMYSFPPAKRGLFSLKDLPSDEKSLASFGFGKLLVKEIIARGGGIKAYQSLLNEKPCALAYSDGELSPFRLVQFDESGEKFNSFSDLLDARLSVSDELSRIASAKKAFEAKRVKLQEVIDAQTKNIVALEKNAVELQRKGELIYEHYQELKDILEELNKAKAKFSLQEIKSKLKGHAKIKDLNPKTGDVIVEL